MTECSSGVFEKYQTGQVLLKEAPASGIKVGWQKQLFKKHAMLPKINFWF